MNLMRIALLMALCYGKLFGGGIFVSTYEKAAKGAKKVASSIQS